MFEEGHGTLVDWWSTKLIIITGLWEVGHGHETKRLIDVQEISIYNWTNVTCGLLAEKFGTSKKEWMNSTSRELLNHSIYGEK